MSLISDALKKAQHERSGPADNTPPMPGTGGRAGRREQSARSLTWIVSGAVGLVVAAVGLTVYFLRPAATPAPAATLSLSSAKAAAAPAASNTAAPVVNPLIIAPAPLVAAPKAADPLPAAVEPATPAPAAAKLNGSPVVTKSAKGVPPDPRIIAFVDAIKVAGIRSSGAESKVLMNDHVFRVNDVVDRLLNVRLTEVAVDSLVFVDGNDVVYTKNF